MTTPKRISLFAVLAVASVFAIGSYAHAQSTSLFGNGTTDTSATGSSTVNGTTNANSISNSTGASTTTGTTNSTTGATSSGSAAAGTSGSASSSNLPPMILSVSSRGRVLLRGTVASASADSLTVNGWGGTWTIRSTTGMSVMPYGATNNGTNGSTGVGAGTSATATGPDLSSIPVGDFVGIEGTIAPDQQSTVDATFVRDWTMTDIANGERLMNESTGASTGAGTNGSGTNGTSY